MKKNMNKVTAAIRRNRLPLGVALVSASGFAMAADGSYDISDAMLYVTGLLAVIGTVGVAWVSVSYLKKGWRALRGA